MPQVGRRLPRRDGFSKVTGRAVFTGDIHLPGYLAVRLLRSPHPHARIRGIHVPDLPGVTVLTGRDVANLGRYGHAIRDKPVLPLERALYAGEPVAALAAPDEDAAREAEERIEIDYEPLPAATNLGEALAPDAPPVHEQDYGEGSFHDTRLTARRGNVCFEFHEEDGDVETAFAAADAVVDDVYTFPRVFQFFLEPHVVAADARDGRITCWSSAQHPYLVRSELARLFDVPLHRVRVVSPHVGGGFGGKAYTLLEPLIVALAFKARLPVRLACTLDESFLTTCRHAARVRMRTAARADGLLLAREAVVELDTGAYADNGPRVAVRAAIRALGPYRLAAYRTRCTAIYSHSVPAGSYRAIGAPQVVWAAESQLDDLARRLGVDPVELRRRNLVAPGERFRGRRRPMDADLPGDLKRLPAADGTALAVSGGGAGPVATALVRLHADGSATLLTSSVEIGQGARTVLAQIAAEELGLAAERVAVPDPDTDAGPFDRSTGASRSTTVMGTAVRAAARDAARRRAGDPEQMEWVGRGYSAPHLNEGRLDSEPVFWEVGMGGADADLDAETGVVRLRRYVSLADVGRAINPLLCEGQEEGAAIQGLGHTLYEEVAGAGAIDYRVPRFEDVPDDFVTLLAENADGPGPYGARGAGEGGIVPVAAAVGNALYRLTGVRLRDLPLTPERVWRALRGL